MKGFRKLLLPFLFLPGFPLLSQSVLTVTYPLERCVFQRDKSNRATIQIAGSISRIAERIEVKFRPIRPGWGEESPWTAIQADPTGGFFSGQTTWVGGWYELEVRGKRGDEVVGSATVGHMGIGEVFLIAGQSNAQGQPHSGSPGASDERVIRADYNGVYGPNEPLPYPRFEHIGSEDVISPRGISAWAWGNLGDELSAHLNVPVLFYNTGWDGSSVINWRESIYGSTRSVYNSDLFFEPSGMPYGNFRNVMQNYVAITGVRAVLWQQGESDNDKNTGYDRYYTELETLINHTRTEFNRNLSWVIARTSYTGISGIDQGIIEAQNAIIRNIPNVFAGPETDLIQVPRPDNYHFKDWGLPELSAAWLGSLNSDFFSHSEPYYPLSPISVSVDCIDSHQMSITMHGSFSEIIWNHGSNNSTVHVGQGNYQVRARDAFGNIVFSPVIRIPDYAGAETPAILTDGPARLCEGGSLVLRASSSDYPRWSNGQSGDEITIHETGNYTVTVRNIYGCTATSAVLDVTLSDKPLPAAPVITAQSATTFCDGNEVILKSSTGANTLWNNGRTQPELAARTSGTFTARTRDEEGCYSPASDGITVKVNPLPSKPVITAEGNTTFCEGNNLTLRSSYSDGNTWSDRSTARNITVTTSGSFTVTYKDGNGCESTSNPLTVTVNPLPKAPVVTALRPTTFCEKDYTTLSSNVQHSYEWNTGAKTRTLRVTAGGQYSLTATDANGCTSPTSTVTTVVVNPVPAKPVVTLDGPATFCASEIRTLSTTAAAGYLWSNGGTAREISTSTAGTYSARVSNEYECFSEPSDAVVLRTLPIPTTPVIIAHGNTDFCDGDHVLLSAQGNPPFLWNTGENAITLEAAVSGNYSARTIGTNGCYSNSSNEIEVKARPVPDQPVIEKTGVYSLTAVTNIPAQFHWQQDNTELTENNAADLKVRQSGTFAAQAFVKYTELLTCSSPVSEPFRFFLDVNSNNFSVYPNPNFQGDLFIETLPDLLNAVVTIYTLKGEAVGTFFPLQTSQKQTLRLPPLSAGVYIIRIHASHFSATEKLVISR